MGTPALSALGTCQETWSRVGKGLSIYGVLGSILTPNKVYDLTKDFCQSVAGFRGVERWAKAGGRQGAGYISCGQKFGTESLSRETGRKSESAAVWSWWHLWCLSGRVQLLSSGLVTVTGHLESDYWGSIGFMLPSIRLGFQPSHKGSARLWRLSLQTSKPCEWVQSLLLSLALGLSPRLWTPILAITQEVPNENWKDALEERHIQTRHLQNFVLVIFFFLIQWITLEQVKTIAACHLGFRSQRSC